MLFRRLFFDKISSVWMVACITTILIMPLIIGMGLYIKAMPLFEGTSVFKLLFSSGWAPSKGAFGFWPFDLFYENYKTGKLSG